MKALTLLGIASAVAMTAMTPAQAAQGCGRGFHRVPNGRCVPNGAMRQTWMVGRYYDGRGYWYNNRWYQHRVRWHNGWRYR